MPIQAHRHPSTDTPQPPTRKGARRARQRQDAYTPTLPTTRELSPTAPYTSSRASSGRISSNRAGCLRQAGPPPAGAPAEYTCPARQRPCAQGHTLHRATAHIWLLQATDSGRTAPGSYRPTTAHQQAQRVSSHRMSYQRQKATKTPHGPAAPTHRSRATPIRQ